MATSEEQAEKGPDAVRGYAFRLHEKEKLSWPDIAKRIEAEGYRNDEGEPFKKGALQVAHTRWNKAGRPNAAEVMGADAPPLSDAPDNLVTPEEPVSIDASSADDDKDPDAPSPDNYDNDAERGNSDNGVNLGESTLPPKSDNLVKDDTIITREEIVTMLTTLEARLTDLIDERMRAATSDKPVTVDNVALPPKPPKTRQKELGSKGDIRARIDSELLKRFEAECKRNFGGNASTALNAILWRYYGQPTLSFELGQEPEEPDA